jgi:hypothetical protein
MNFLHHFHFHLATQYLFDKVRFFDRSHVHSLSRFSSRVSFFRFLFLLLFSILFRSYSPTISHSTNTNARSTRRKSLIRAEGCFSSFYRVARRENFHLECDEMFRLEPLSFAAIKNISRMIAPLPNAHRSLSTQQKHLNVGNKTLNLPFSKLHFYITSHQTCSHFVYFCN